MVMEVGRVGIAPKKIEISMEPPAEKKVPINQGEEVKFGNPPNTQELIAETFKLKAIDEEKLTEIIEKLNRIFDVMGTELRFKVHEQTNDIIVQVIEVSSGKILREIPPEKILNMIAQMMQLVGLLVDEKA